MNAVQDWVESASFQTHPGPVGQSTIRMIIHPCLHCISELTQDRKDRIDRLQEQVDSLAAQLAQKASNVLSVHQDRI